MAGFTVIPLNPEYKEREYGEIFFTAWHNSHHGTKKTGTTDATTVARSRNIPIIELIPVSQMAGKFELSPDVVHETKKAEFATRMILHM